MTKRRITVGTVVVCLCGLLSLLFITEVRTLRKLESISFDAMAYEKAREAVLQLDSLFSEADRLGDEITTCIRNMRYIREGDLEKLLEGRHYSPDGFYLVNPGTGHISFFSL